MPSPCELLKTQLGLAPRRGCCDGVLSAGSLACVCRAVCVQVAVSLGGLLQPGCDCTGRRCLGRVRPFDSSLGATAVLGQQLLALRRARALHAASAAAGDRAFLYSGWLLLAEGEHR